MSRMDKGSDAGRPDVSPLPKYSNLAEYECRLFGHAEDFPLFERLGEIRTCSNCHHVFRWTGKRWEETVDAFVPPLTFDRVIFAVIVMALLVALFAWLAPSIPLGRLNP